MEALPYYLWICLVTAFVCTAVKEDDPGKLARGTGRLFGTVTLGILVFAVAVQGLCYLILP